MSYILDALKKADRERSLGAVPDLETAHWRVRRKKRSKIWVWVIGALLVFNGVLIATFLLEGDEHEQQAESLQAQPAVAMAPQRRSLIPEPAPRPVTPAPRLPVTEAPARTTRPRVQLPPPVVRAPSPQPAAEPSLPALPDSPPAGEPAALEGEEFEFPEWRELSLDFRSGITLPRIDVHVHAEDPARRFIMADLKKYREGDTLANGALLEKIHPGSIQLNYRGTRFRVER